MYVTGGAPAFHDFSDRPDFSFDFVADTGDGWGATAAVADLMAEPRSSVKYVNVAPDDSGW
jgi:hypothetical protein